MSGAPSDHNRDIALRPADADDWETIRALACRIWPAAYDGILTDEQIQNMLAHVYSEENLRREIDAQGHRFWLASQNGKDVAYVSGYLQEDTAWVKKLYVDPDYHSLGIGRALIAQIEQAFPTARELRLLANPNNAPALDFYRRAGFSDAGRLRVQMGDFEFLDHIFARPIHREGAPASTPDEPAENTADERND